MRNTLEMRYLNIKNTTSLKPFPLCLKKRKIIVPNHPYVIPKQPCKSRHHTNEILT